jgi:predicted MFS family arabinose efflux permease
MTGLIGLFCVSLLQGGITNLSPAIAGISRALGRDPNTVAQIGTFPAIFAVLACLLIGQLAGRVLKYKTILIVSLLISILGGSLPMFFPSWPVILFSRVCVGLGVGVFFTLPPSLIMKFFSGKKQRVNLGIATASGCIGGFLAMLVAGLLVDIKWVYTFGIYAFGIPAFILVCIGLPEPDSSVEHAAAKEKVKLPVPVILNFIMIFLAFTLWIPTQLFISNIIIDRNMGSGVHAGIVAIMFNISAITLTVLFAPLYRIFHKYLAAIILFLCGCGIFLIYYADNLVTAGIGMFLIGSIMLLIPTLLSDNACYLAPKDITFATSLLMIALNLGIFAAGPFSSLASIIRSDRAFPGIFFAIFAMAFMCLCCLFIRIFQKNIPVRN